MRPDVPALQRSSSFYHTEERTVAMEISESISQLPSDDFTVVFVTTIIFLLMEILILLFFNMDSKIILWLTIALICGLWYICILEIV